MRLDSSLLLSRFSCVQLCDPIDSIPPGSAIPGILQARILEWVAISFSMGSSQPCLKYLHYKLGSSLWVYYLCFQKIYVQVLMVNPQLL